MLRIPFVSALAVLVFLGCGGGEGQSNFTVQPAERTVAVGDQLPLAAQPEVDLAGDLAWEVEEQYGGGLRNTQGASTLYFAPEAAGTYHLTLRAVRADGRPLKQTFAIQVLAVPSIDPAQVQLPQGGSVTFTATMKGLARNTVTWQVAEPGGGDISEDGHYLAPAKGGTYHVTAVSTLDPAVSAQATVVVE